MYHRSSSSALRIPSYFYIYAILALSYTPPAAGFLVVGDYAINPVFIVSPIIILLCIVIFFVWYTKQKRQRAAALAQKRDVEAGTRPRDESFLQQQELAQGQGPVMVSLPSKAAGDDSSFVSQSTDREEKYPVPTYAVVQEPQPVYDQSGISAPMMMDPNEAGGEFRRGYLPRPGDMRRTPSPSNRAGVGRI
ncbi:hypothetical protein C8F01DRAFT_46623 [Mycena amicta]|nr:hypothetical protein C8F01DRAFT_46623 [Mycena amicta]